MNARELHDKLSRSGANPDLAEFCAGHATILRALDLLAAVESSGDEIVRELRGQHCRDFGSDPQCDADGLCICAMHERAAAALFAERAAKEKAEADLDRALEACKDHLYRMSEVEAERDSFKRHAEAMASELLDLRDGRLIGTQAVVVDQYRRDFPKDTP